MPEDVETKPATSAGAGNFKTPGKSVARLDLATLSGLAIALLGIVGGLLLERGSIADIAQGTAALIVLGGTVGAVLVTTPMPVILRAVSRLRSVFFEGPEGGTGLSSQLIGFATKARKQGIVSLEAEAAAVQNPFFRKALNLAVDGTDLQELRKMMELDIALGEQTAESEARVWESAGGYAPTIGIIGAVMGLIQVMKHLEDIKEVGHGIAVAFVATVYGVASANLFFLPAAAKLRARARDATLLNDMILEGVIGIVEGLNPTLIRLKLESYNPAPAPAGAKGKGKKKDLDAGAEAARGARGARDPAPAQN